MVAVWVWMNFAFYADQFDTDDLVFRLVMFAAMLAVAAFAVSLPAVSTGLVLAFLVIRACIIGLYERARRHVPAARSFCAWCVGAYGFGAACWAASLLVDGAPRYVLWGVGVAAEMAVPVFGPVAWDQMPVHASHIPERFGLFTIIVFGEAVVLTALGVAHQDWALRSAATAGLCFAATCALWWLYFDRIEGIGLRESIRENLTFIYAHIPLLVAFIAVAVGVELAVEHAERGSLETVDRALLCGGLAIALLALAAIQRATVPGPPRPALVARVAAAALLAVLVAPALPAVAVAATLALVLIALCVVDERSERREAAYVGGASESWTEYGPAPVRQAAPQRAASSSALVDLEAGPRP